MQNLFNIDEVNEHSQKPSSGSDGSKGEMVFNYI